VKLSLSHLFPLLLVLGLALLSVWLERAVNRESRHPALIRHDPDYIVDRFSLVTFDGTGRSESTLSAEKMLHYPDDDTTEILLPRVQQSRAGGPLLTLSAQRGVLTRDGAELFLHDKVELTRAPGKGRAVARLETSFIHFVRSKSLASTDREVLFTDAGRSLRGRGMEYDGELHRLVLKNEVRGRFEPGKNRS